MTPERPYPHNATVMTPQGGAPVHPAKNIDAKYGAQLRVAESARALRDLIKQWEVVGVAQRQLAEHERDTGLRASLLAAANAWMTCADDLRKCLGATT